jgi:hypothetical protein
MDPYNIDLIEKYLLIKKLPKKSVLYIAFMRKVLYNIYTYRVFYRHIYNTQFLESVGLYS